MFGIEPEKVEVAPEHTLLPNEITDEEIEKIAKPYGPAFLKRLTDAALQLSKVMVRAAVDAAMKERTEKAGLSAEMVLCRASGRRRGAG